MIVAMAVVVVMCMVVGVIVLVIVTMAGISCVKVVMMKLCRLDGDRPGNLHSYHADQRLGIFWPEPWRVI